METQDWSRGPSWSSPMAAERFLCDLWWKVGRGGGTRARTVSLALFASCGILAGIVFSILPRRQHSTRSRSPGALGFRVTSDKGNETVTVRLVAALDIPRTGEACMRKTARFAIRGRWITVTAAVLLLFLLPIALTACGGTSAPPTEQPAPTEVAAATAMPTEEPTQAPTPTEPPPTDTPTPTDTPLPTDTPTPEPTDTPTPEPIDDSGCIACHTDEGVLQELAEEPEEAESLSEGEG